MKKVQIKGKLQLNKMQIASISDLHMAQIVGGDGGGSVYACGGSAGDNVGTTNKCITRGDCVNTIGDPNCRGTKYSLCNTIFGW